MSDLLPLFPLPTVVLFLAWWMTRPQVDLNRFFFGFIPTLIPTSVAPPTFAMVVQDQTLQQLVLQLRDLLVQRLVDRLRMHVERLATAIGERNVFVPDALHRAAS